MIEFSPWNLHGKTRQWTLQSCPMPSHMSYLTHMHRHTGPVQRDGSAVKSICCSSRGPKCYSQPPYQAAYSHLYLQLFKSTTSDLCRQLHSDIAKKKKKQKTANIMLYEEKNTDCFLPKTERNKAVGVSCC